MGGWVGRKKGLVLRDNAKKETSLLRDELIGDEGV
jgi:hypothetical protein